MPLRQKIGMPVGEQGAGVELAHHNRVVVDRARNALGSGQRTEIGERAMTPEERAVEAVIVKILANDLATIVDVQRARRKTERTFDCDDFVRLRRGGRRKRERDRSDSA